MGETLKGKGDFAADDVRLFARADRSRLFGRSDLAEQVTYFGSRMLTRLLKHCFLAEVSGSS